MGRGASKCFFFFLTLQTIYSSEDFDHIELLKNEQHEQIFPSYGRELLNKQQFETSLEGTVIPTTTDVPTNPAYNPIPVTNPTITPSTVPGQQPITNPVTTNPNVPTTIPVPPATTNSSSTAVPGQSWCVAKSGAPQTTLQSALDYACGAGADCSQIQQGASCYSPNTLQNHASYAFNSYYQKSPSPTGCDFGGTASLVNTNPSTGSCIFPTSSSSQSSTPPSTPTLTPPSTITPPSTPSLTPPSTPLASPLSASPLIPTETPPTSTTTSPDWAGVSGSGSPPPGLNSSYPDSDLGFDSPPPGLNRTTSKAIGLRPFISCIFLVTLILGY